MASALNLISNWTSSHAERVELNKNEPELVLRWLNEAQLRFADKSEILKSVWTPVIDSDGIAALPDDFLREVPNRVKWDSQTILTKGNYADLINLQISSTLYYSIWGEKFYVFSPAEGEPEIPYVVKPSEIVSSSLSTADLDIPSQYHLDLILFLDGMWQRRSGDVMGGLSLMRQFEDYATRCGMKESQRKDPVPMMRTSIL